VLAESDRVKVLTPLDSSHAGAIGFFAVDGIDSAKLGAWLLDKYRIVTTPIVHRSSRESGSRRTSTRRSMKWIFLLKRFWRQ
jgi:hypothetical protein